MRTIKFRAWDKDREIMIGSDYPKNWGSDLDEWYADAHLMDLVGIEGISNNYRFEVMQFTGLTDKNGKEIYEGDIIALRGIDDEKDYFYEIHKAESGTWMGCNELYWDLKSPDFVKLEVVGNKFENPTLLEDKK